MVKLHVIQAIQTIGFKDFKQLEQLTFWGISQIPADEIHLNVVHVFI